MPKTEITYKPVDVDEKPHMAIIAIFVKGGRG